MNRGVDAEGHGVSRELDMQDASGMLGSGSWKDLEGLCVQHRGGEGLGRRWRSFRYRAGNGWEG